MNSTDLLIEYDAVDLLIATPIDVDGLIFIPIDSMDCADTNVSDDDVDRLMMLMY